MPHSDMVERLVEALRLCETVLERAVCVADIDELVREAGLPPHLQTMTALDAATEALTAYEYEQLVEAAVRPKAAVGL